MTLAWLACGAGEVEWDNPAAQATDIAASEIEPGITWRQAVIEREGTPMRVWLYAPTHADGALPLVVVGPAGSDMVTGMALSDGDRPEHLPYARRGFVVVSFDIDGGYESRLEYGAAANAYSRADNGVANARAALDYALANEPRIDPRRIYAAGHSSAATLALVFTAKEPRVRAVASYAPVADLPGYLENGGSRLDREGRSRAEAFSPLHLASQIDVPVFLFDSSQDQVIDGDAVDRLWAAIPENEASERTRVERGDHYGSMIDPGIPRAIRWMNDLVPTP